jgi:hypothetical protein
MNWRPIVTSVPQQPLRQMSGWKLKLLSQPLEMSGLRIQDFGSCSHNLSGLRPSFAAVGRDSCPDCV